MHWLTKFAWKPKCPSVSWYHLIADSNWCLTLLKLWSYQCTLDPKVDAFTGGRGAVIFESVIALSTKTLYNKATQREQVRQWDSKRQRERGPRMREELRTQRRTKCQNCILIVLYNWFFVSLFIYLSISTLLRTEHRKFFWQWHVNSIWFSCVIGYYSSLILSQPLKYIKENHL